MTSLKKKKNIAIVVDTFYPHTTSAAVQMYDLAIELIKLGINYLSEPWLVQAFL